MPLPDDLPDITGATEAVPGAHALHHTQEREAIAAVVAWLATIPALNVLCPAIDGTPITEDTLVAQLAGIFAVFGGAVSGLEQTLAPLPGQVSALESATDGLPARVTSLEQQPTFDQFIDENVVVTAVDGKFSPGHVGLTATTDPVTVELPNGVTTKGKRLLVTATMDDGATATVSVASAGQINGAATYVISQTGTYELLDAGGGEFTVLRAPAVPAAPAALTRRTYVFEFPGAATIHTGQRRQYVPEDETVVGAIAQIGTPAEANDIKADVFVNGVSMFGVSPPPYVQNGQSIGPLVVPADPDLAEGDELRCDIWQIGNPEPGQNLVVTVITEKA